MSAPEEVKGPLEFEEHAGFERRIVNHIGELGEDRVEFFKTAGYGIVQDNIDVGNGRKAALMERNISQHNRMLNAEKHNQELMDKCDEKNNIILSLADIIADLIRLSGIGISEFFSLLRQYQLNAYKDSLKIRDEYRQDHFIDDYRGDDAMKESEGVKEDILMIIPSIEEIITRDEQYAERMRRAFTPMPHKDNTKIMTDAHTWHTDADEVLCSMLLSLGYSETVREFKEGKKWYA